MFEAAFRVREYADGVPFEGGGFEMVAHRVLHYTMPAFGFRVAQGLAVLGYSGDCGPNGGLAQIAREIVGVGVTPSSRWMIVSTAFAASTSSAVRSAGRESAWVSLPM